MRTGISITVGSSDRLRLEGVVKERNFAQKHVWRAAIILLSVNGGAKLVHPGGAKLVHLTLCGTRCWGVVPAVKQVFLGISAVFGFG